MRKIGFTLLVLSFVLAIITVHHSGLQPAQCAVHQGDLVLTGNNVMVIEDQIFEINGSILVEENATLIVRNATVTFIQTENYEFNLTLRFPLNGHPRLSMYDSTITSNRIFIVRLEGNSTASFLNSLATRFVYATDNSTLSIQDSSVYYPRGRDYSTVIVHNSTIYEWHNYDSPYIQVSDSEIGSFLTAPTTVNCTIDNLDPGLASYWNFFTNCSVITPSAGYSPNVTLTNSTIERWRFGFYGQSNVTISNSNLTEVSAFSGDSTIHLELSSCDRVSISSSSKLYATDSNINLLKAYQTTTTWLTNSTVVTSDLYDSSNVFVNWYLDVHVVDLADLNLVAANVTAAYQNTTIAKFKLTGLDGWTRLTLQERKVNITGEYPVGNYTVEAALWGYSNSVEVNMTDNQLITLTLEGFPQAVYIRPDGSVYPAEAPVQQDGNLYTLMDNLYLPLAVEKDHIIVDGADHTIQGQDVVYSVGVDLSVRDNVTVRSINIVNFHCGVQLNMSSLCVISGNNLSYHRVYGVRLHNSSNNIVTNNRFLEVMGSVGSGAINIYDSSDNIISENVFEYCYRGVKLSDSSRNIISLNTFSKNVWGIEIQSSSYNTIVFNQIVNNTRVGIDLAYFTTHNNTIYGNTITHNDKGIMLYQAFDNMFYHNNFIENTQQVHVEDTNYSNRWDDGFEGNYWSNYTGVDLDHNGIGDTSHLMDANNTDYYPLMGTFNSFLGVDVISDCVIESFESFSSNQTIRIYISNQTSDQTSGFCRVCIPQNLIDPSDGPIIVFIDDGQTPTLFFNNTLHDNGTHRWIYFALELSTHKVVIVPELPYTLILPLFMITTFLTVIFYRRKRFAIVK